MTPEDIVTFNDSLARCVSQDTFLDRFYEVFLASSPTVPEKFADTDFMRQKRMLRYSLYMMVMAAEGDGEATAYLERIAAKHSHTDRDIPPEMYDLWLDSLIRAASEHDPDFDDHTEGVWRAMMQQGIEFLVSRY